jgi:hypothetical protein
MVLGTVPPTTDQTRSGASAHADSIAAAPDLSAPRQMHRIQVGRTASRLTVMPKISDVVSEYIGGPVAKWAQTRPAGTGPAESADMQFGDDGTVDLCFGPAAPAGPSMTAIHIACSRQRMIIVYGLVTWSSGTLTVGTSDDQ